MNPTQSRPLTWVLAVGQLLTWGIFYYALPVFVDPISKELGWNRQLIFEGLSAALLVSVLTAPFVGRQIDRGLGKSALICGQIVGTVCIASLGGVSHPAWFLLLCCGLGVAQGACFYETAFSLLHRQLEEAAPSAIVRVTLIAGFAGTVFVPGSQYLVDHLGWRESALLLAAVSLIPPLIYAVGIPPDHAEPVASDAQEPPSEGRLEWTAAIFAMVAAFAASTATFSTVTIHFLPLLVDRGVPAFEAAKIFALVGPSQIVARIFIWLVPLRTQVLKWGLLVFALQAASIAMLWYSSGAARLAGFAMLFGVSSGLLTVVRGTAPAEICDRRFIGRLNGVIGGAGGLFRALAPAAFALLLARSGQSAALGILFAISLCGGVAFVLARLFDSVADRHRAAVGMEAGT